MLEEKFFFGGLRCIHNLPFSLVLSSFASMGWNERVVPRSRRKLFFLPW